MPKTKLDSEVARVMDRVNITDVKERIIAKLSKGYKQRVGIAQALLNDPPVLILDEPTIGLDPKQIHEVRELIKDLAGKHTVVLSTHILPEVEQTCHRVIIIDHGKIVAVDTPQNLRFQLQGAERISIEVQGPVTGNPFEAQSHAGRGGRAESADDATAITGSRLKVNSERTFAAIWRAPLCRTVGACTNCSPQR